MGWIKSRRTPNVVHWAEHWPGHGWLTGCGWPLADGEVVIWVEGLRFCKVCQGHLDWRLGQVGLEIAEKQGVKMAGWELIYEPCRLRIGEVAEVLAKTSGKGLDLRYGSTVYVAYLTPGYRLLNVYGIQLMMGEDPIGAVARDAQSQKWICQVIVGEAAELLFLAIAGRLSWESVRAANPLRALQARSVLAFGIDREPGFSEAYAAVAQWGDFIRPWFGATALDERGGLLLDLSEYDETVDLPMVVPALD